MKWAKYHLAFNSPSFDLLTFMQPALDRGCEAVLLVPGFSGWSGYGGEKGEAKRLQEIVLPILKLYGMKILEGGGKKNRIEGEMVWPEGDNSRDGHSIRHLLGIKKAHSLMPTQEALDRVWDQMGGRKRIVVPVRHCDYQEKRNTSEDMLRWAKDVDAFIVPEGTPLDDRVAAYEHASLVAANSAGNVTPATYSHRPFMLLKMIVPDYKSSNESYLADRGIAKGFQYPWARADQRIMWGYDDSYKEICAAVEEHHRLSEEAKSR